MLKSKVKLFICFFISFLVLISSNSVFASDQVANQYALSADLEEWTFHNGRSHAQINIFQEGANLYVTQLKKGVPVKTWTESADAFKTFILGNVSEDDTNNFSYEYSVNFYHKKYWVNTLIKGSVLTKDVAKKSINLKAKVYQIANSTVSLVLPNGVELKEGTSLQATITTKNIDDKNKKKTTTFNLPIDGKETILRDDWGNQKLLDPEEDLSYLDNDYKDSIKLVGEDQNRKISLTLKDGSSENFIVSTQGDYVHGIKVVLTREGEARPEPEPQPPVPPQPQPQPIPDSPNDGLPGIKFHEPVESIPVYVHRQDEIEKGIHYIYIYGYEDKTIRPEGKLTRAEAVAMLLRLVGEDLSNKSKLDFVDTPSAWYNGALNAAMKKKLLIADGNKLRPNEPITRGEFAYALSKMDSMNDAKAPYRDIRGHVFEDAINQEYGNGRIKGYPDGTFKPDNNLTRAEAATLLNNFARRRVTQAGLVKVNDKVKVFPDIDESHWAYYEIVEAGHTHRYERPSHTLDETWVEILE